MRKVIAQVMLSVDGYFEDAKQRLDWHHVDQSYHQYSEELLHQTDYLLFGRKTYEHMASFWPTDHAYSLFPKTANYMNQTPKIVASHTMKDSNWLQTEIINEGLYIRIYDLKNEDKKGYILLLASAQLNDALLKNQLLDELHVIVTPILLGQGTPYFKDASVRLQLLESRVLGADQKSQPTDHTSGNLLLRYKPLYV
ncbi:dihydrofolate reductase family protein [Alkalihalobacillus pseudalcaliphilus]|uniref:dihydrofolate reductase family protein n=1 Tax=Alkalihalobacillus pseudalcaliphilus TaxID=79884 RepID=UPI00064DDC8D|nr:dihydrofolate reductase family protein [Alkalihalobacillus pseudalcaliphilus]KMK78284.1 hypothetical protein AB990_02295 [Alkalihalobacillus pseudalcaliphilus]